VGAWQAGCSDAATVARRRVASAAPSSVPCSTLRDGELFCLAAAHALCEQRCAMAELEPLHSPPADGIAVTTSFVPQLIKSEPAHASRSGSVARSQNRPAPEPPSEGIRTGIVAPEIVLERVAGHAVAGVPAYSSARIGGLRSQALRRHRPCERPLLSDRMSLVWPQGCSGTCERDLGAARAAALSSAGASADSLPA
jgi:hypothetical protein